uniref:Glutathione peroxidase_like protein d n=1 Tax=Phallusia mammillata TaxID=59560 RepID=A0A6F9DDB6_9ASCI|nr:glutathione peroxidase_like protein d precursor [Phallusia mammillata]
MFSKIEVNGKGASPLFKFLQKHKNTSGTLTNAIKWNFTKFLVDKDGIPRKRYSPQTSPLSMENDIKKML